MCGNKASTVYRACSIQLVCVYADHIYIHIYNIYIYILSGIQNMFSQADAAGGAAAGGEGGGVVCDGDTIVDVGAHVGLAAIAFAMRCILYIYIYIIVGAHVGLAAIAFAMGCIGFLFLFVL